MTDKLFNKSAISTQIEFDQFGAYKLTEVMDLEMLEMVGGGEGGGIKIDIPPMNFVCNTTNNCPPQPQPQPTPQPTPTPTPPPQPQPSDQDGDG